MCEETLKTILPLKFTLHVALCGFKITRACIQTLISFFFQLQNLIQETSKLSSAMHKELFAHKIHLSA